VNTFLKIVMAACVVGIVAVVAVGLQSDAVPEDETLSPALPPTLVLSTTPPSGPTSEPEPEQTEELAADTPSPAFWIEELTAECDAGEEFGVTALPLGTDWRVTERGVYKNSPVTITCETGGAIEGLTYDWSADEGEIEGSGASIVWTAPDHGAKIQVSVMVRDSSGGEELAALYFRVATCECVYQRYE